MIKIAIAIIANIIKIPTPIPALNIPFTKEQLVIEMNIIIIITILVILSFIVSWFLDYYW